MKKSLLISPLFLLIYILCGCRPQGESSITRNYSTADTSYVIQLIDSANVCFDKADYASALFLSRQGAEISVAISDTAMWSECLSCMVATYQSLGLTDSAILYSRQLLQLDEALGDPFALSSDYSNLAFIYTSTGIDMDEALFFINKSIECEKQVEGQPKMGIRYGIASEIYNGMGMTDEALKYIRMAYELDSLAGNSIRMGRRLSQMGDICIKDHQFVDAERCYLHAISLLEAVGERHSLGITYRQLGSLYLNETGDREQAISWLEKAVSIALDDHELHSLVKTYERLGEAYQAIDPAQSNKYLLLYTEAKDSLTKEEKRRMMTEFKVQYDTDTQKALAEERSRELHSTRFYGLLSISVLAIVAVCLLYLLRKRVLRNRQLDEHIQELREQLSDQREQYQAQMKQEIVIQTKYSEEEQAFLDRVNSTIFDIMGKSELTTETVASRLCITSQQLRRRIQAILGQGGGSSNSYISAIRTNYAKDLLLNQRQLSITEVARLCGFEDPAHFTRSFKKETGVTPSEFRK